MLTTVVFAVEYRTGAEYDCFIVDSVWSTEKAAIEYAKAVYVQSRWGSSVPEWIVTPYTLNKGN